MSALAAAARAFARAAAGELEGLAERDAARRALEGLAAEGFLRWTVPERDGGAPAEGRAEPGHVCVRALCELRAELAQASGLLDVMCVMQGLGSYPIALGGSEALRREVLPAVARGERVAAFALTEPGAGSNLAEVATRLEDRDGALVLEGHKTFISNAGLADFYCVLARESGEVGEREGLRMVYVPATSPGIDVRPFEVMAPHPIGEVLFRGVRVEPAQRLGAPGSGLELALATLGRFRTTVAAAACGFARRALDESAAHLARREQFGKPLAANQGLRFDLAEMDVRLRAAELLVAEAAAAADDGRESTAAVARAKLFATEAASWICDRAVQHFGGLGVKRGETVERLFREVRALRIYEGTSEIQKLILAKELLRKRERD